MTLNVLAKPLEQIQLPSMAYDALCARTSASISSLSTLPHVHLLFLPHNVSPFFVLLLFSQAGKCRLAPSCRLALGSNVTSVRIFLNDPIHIALLPHSLSYYLFVSLIASFNL